MVPGDFSPAMPGELIRAVGGHWTFEPSPLPPPLSLNWEMIEQLSVADQALGRLAGVGRRLPNPSLLIRPFIRREAVLSSRIEGTVTRLDQLFLFEAEPEGLAHPSDALEVENYVQAVEQGFTALRDGYPLNEYLIRGLHERLLSGVRGPEMRPGQLRDRAVLIGHPGQTFSTARFVPPCHTKVGTLLKELVDYINNPGPIAGIVMAALVHYQFETIHPFNDGNGRVGRLLIALLLGQRGVLPEPLLYLSAYFEANREAYYDALHNVSRHGLWIEWLRFVTQGIREQAEDAAIRADRLLDVLQRRRGEVMSSIRSPTAPRLVEELVARPYLTTARAAEMMGMSTINAQRIVDRFCELGLLREVTGRQRNRIYCADEVMRLLDGPVDVDN